VSYDFASDPYGIITDHLRAFAHGETPPPYRLFAYPTERCNLRCPSCGMTSGDILPGTEELDDESYMRVADEAIELGVKEVYLTGGEVMVRKPMILDFMEKIARAGIRGVLSTNGTLFTREDIQRLVDARWDLLVFSLDGPTAAINDPLRGQDGAFDRTVEAIRTVIELRGDAIDRKPDVDVNMVVSRANAGSIHDMVELTHSLGINTFMAEPIVHQWQACDDMMLDDASRTILREDIARAAARARELGFPASVEFLADDTITAEETTTAEVNAADTEQVTHPFYGIDCFVPFYNLVVHPNGVIGGCWRQRDDSSIRLPDVSLREAWEQHKARQLRQSMLDHEVPGFCHLCCLVNAGDNRRYRAILMATEGDPAEAEAALRTAMDNEPHLPIHKHGCNQFCERTGRLGDRVELSASCPCGSMGTGGEL
jgi:MoaA/NifB/PqqE/SkfB family radical SAM enzyme